MEHQAETTIKIEGEDVSVNALRGKQLATVGGHVGRILTHLYASRGQSVISIVNSGSKLTIEALFEVLATTSSLDVEAIGDLVLADLVRLVNSWLEVNRIEEIAPLFFSLKQKIKQISETIPTQKPIEKPD